MTTAEHRYQTLLADATIDTHDHLARLRQAAHGTVLELGTRTGNSTAALLAGIEERGGQVWSVDIDPGCATIWCAGHPRWHFVLADSRDRDRVLAAGLVEPIDLLFVDSEHTFDHVLDELHVWEPAVRDGGLLLLHDTDTIPEVRYAVEQYCWATGLEFELLHGSNGLAVIRKPTGDVAAQRRALIVKINRTDKYFRAVCPLCQETATYGKGHSGACSCGGTYVTSAAVAWHRHPSKGVFEQGTSTPVHTTYGEQQRLAMAQAAQDLTDPADATVPAAQESYDSAD